MWGSFKTLVAQYYNYTQDETGLRTTDDLDGWVIVDKTGQEVEKKSIEAELWTSPKKLIESHLTPLPLLDISNTSSPQSSPQLSPTKTEEGWLIAPPPCFTLNCPSIEISPLEDLLIEHPSMSVYKQIPNYLLHSKKIEEENMVPEQFKPEKMEAEPRFSSLPPTLHKSPSKNGLTTSKSNHDLAGLMVQIETMKPGQQAKWEKEQHKFCPSYLTRQNKVHRYQSRKHHNQKKKSLAKPFAEKGGRHSF